MVLIDRTHRTWAVGTALLLVSSIGVYVVAAGRGDPMSGGTPVGLTFGVLGFGMLLYAALLGVRKKFPIWRIGRAQTWMRGHLWLGTVALPIIVLHAGLTFGGGLAAVLMWLFVIVVASGVLGAYLQHTMPRRLMRDVPMETIYDQIDHVRAQLLAEADTVVADACGKLEIETVAPTAQPSSAAVSVGTMAKAGAAALASTARLDAEASAPLRQFYDRDMRPFLEWCRQPARAAHPLADRAQAALRFEKVRALVPTALHPAITDLENICEEERQLLQQQRLHRVLHGWQLVHVPLSVALLVLTIVHIIVALRY